MEKRTKKLLLIGLIVFVILLIYSGYEGYLFFHDSRVMADIQEDMSRGLQDQALIKCENMHYWRTTLCSSLRVAVEVARNESIKPYYCNEIIVDYDGPWWLPVKQKYIDDLNERKRTCITTILSRHNLS